MIWPGHCKTFGSIGIVLKPRSIASITSAHPTDAGTVRDTNGRRTGLGTPYSRQAVTDTLYQGSGSWRGSEANFRDLISPFAGRLASQQIDQLLDAIIENGQNWDAAETDTLLLEILRNAEAAEQPTPDARNRFYQHVRGVRRTDKYAEVLTFFQADGWVLPPPEQEEDQ